MCAALVDMGFGLVLNLQERHEDGREGSSPYESQLLAAAERSNRDVRTIQVPIRDHGVPTQQQARYAIDMIMAAIEDDTPTYLHCWGGHGRTGVIAGCLLRERGMSADEALAAIREARSYHRDGIARIASPQTAAQVQFVRDWRGGPGA